MSFMSRLSFVLFCSALLGVCFPAAADTPPATPAEAKADSTAPDAAGQGGESLAVRGVARPDDLPYSSFVAAMHAFDEYHHYAPSAPLLFSVGTHDSKYDHLRVSITGKEVWVPIPVDAGGHFTLPMRQDALDDKAVVMSNLRNGEVNWGPVIRTPNLPEGTLRLGDLRLFCRVGLALDRPQTSLWVLAVTHMVGGCNSDGYVTRGLKQPGMRVQLTYQDRTETLPERYYVAHHTAWTIPLKDGDWPDDTLVQFLAPDSNFVLDKACADKLKSEAQRPYAHGASATIGDGCRYYATED
ncbi:MAG: hypothetical protein JO142_09200 [Burkholderiales bacterium]|nr:hypothetical protein [Burkholderiales bacterium]